MTLIKIDRKSIKKNPNAGKQHYQEMIGQNITLYVSWADFTINHEDLEKRLKKDIGDTVRLTRFSTSERSGNSAEFIMIDEPTDTVLEQLKKDGFNSTVSIHNNWQDIHSLFPEPDYNYKHKRTRIKCNACEKTFYHDMLRSDSSGCECCETDDYSDSVCPKCGVWDCCEIEYERIEDVVND